MPATPDLTPEQLAALQRFAADYGPHWKARLREQWANGRDGLRADGGYLRQVRNQQAPGLLQRLRLPPPTA